MWWIDLDVASRHGRIQLLNNLVHVAHQYPRKRPLKYSSHAADAASAAGHVCVLDWWLNHHQAHTLALTYTADAFDLAAANGHLDCVQWWMHQSLRGRGGIKLKSTHRAVDLASANGHVGVLQFLLVHAQAGHFTFRVTIEGIAAAVKHDFSVFGGHEHPALEWWLHAHIKNEYFTVDHLNTRCAGSTGEATLTRPVVTPAVQAAECGDLAALEMLDQRSQYMSRTRDWDMVVAACRSGKVEVVEWCWAKTMRLPDDPYDDRNWYGIMSGGGHLEQQMRECFLSASEGGHVQVLEWLRKRYIGRLAELTTEPGLVERALVAASREGHVAVLDWWKTLADQSLVCPEDALVEASVNSRIGVLKWWQDWVKHSCQLLPCSTKATSAASGNCQLAVLEWWLNESECELAIDTHSIVATATTSSHVPVLEFWMHQGALDHLSSLTFSGQDLVVLDWWCQQLHVQPQHWLREGLALPSYILYFCLARQSHPRISECTLVDHALVCHDPLLMAALIYAQPSIVCQVSEGGAARALEAASYRGKLDFVSWWVGASGLPVPANGRYLEYASAGGHSHVLTWWVKCSGVTFTVVDAHVCLELAKWSGNLDEVMAWWYESGLFGLHEEDTIEQGQSCRHVKVEALYREISVVSNRYLQS